MKRLARTLVPAAILVLAAPALARTWRVEKDGSGDFTVIQDAVNHASPGDEILIGPGTFEEYSFAWNNTQWDVYCCVFATRDDLLIQGAGPGQTIIGLPGLDSHPDLDINGIGMIQNSTLVVRDLTVRGCEVGVWFESSHLDVAGCEFTGCEDAILSWGTGSNRIDDCYFHDNLDDCIQMVDGARGVTVTNCRIVDGCEGIQLPNVGNAEVRDCQFEGGSGGLGAYEATSVNVIGCTFTNQTNVGLGVGWFASAEVSGCYFSAGQGDIHFNGPGPFRGTNNVLEWCSWTSMDIEAATDIEFTGNHLLPGPGPGMSVIARQSWNDCPDVCHLDFTGNYWGTKDSGAIKARIEDYTDFDPPDPWHYAIVDFSPFEEEEVRTENLTWGDVKSLFR